MKSEEKKEGRPTCRRPVSEEQRMSERVGLQTVCVRDGVKGATRGASWAIDLYRHRLATHPTMCASA